MWQHKKIINNFMTLVSNNNYDGELWIYGDIVDDKYFDNEVSPASVKSALDELGIVGKLKICINSYGGSVPAGNAIIAMLDRYRSQHNTYIEAYIDGIAASMGSGIAMVADKIYMASNALFMVHKPLTIVMGNTDDLQDKIDILQKSEDTLVKNYMRHFKGTEDELRQLLADETWLTAEEALKYGFCDEIVEAVPVAASAKGIVINGHTFMQDAEKIVARFGVNTPVANTIEIKKGVNKNMSKTFEYDERLNDFGVTAESFAEIGISAESLLGLLDNVAKTIIPAPVENQIVLTTEQIADSLGSEVGIDDILAFAKAGMEIDIEMDAKAKNYDKLFAAAIDDAIKIGIKAKGDNFNETKWRKILAALDYAEILDQKKEWEEEAKHELNAGKKVSEPWNGSIPSDEKLVNPEDYKFC